MEIKNFEEAIKPAELSKLDNTNMKSTGIPVSFFESNQGLENALSKQMRFFRTSATYFQLTQVLTCGYAFWKNLKNILILK